MSEPIRIGGQALGDGVLMRSKNYWAIARDDGSVEWGFYRSLVERYPKLDVFLLRSVIALVEGVAFAFKAQARSHPVAKRLYFWIALYVALVAPLAIAEEIWFPDDFAVHAVFLLLSFAGAIFFVGRGLPGDVWAYHGAEHKAVNAYEAGVRNAPPSLIQKFSRVHPRCGTNLIGILFLSSMFYAVLDGVDPPIWFAAVYGIAAPALAIEVFRHAARAPASRSSRALLFAGTLVQRCITTREPTDAQVEVAMRALNAVLDLQAAASER